MLSVIWVAFLALALLCGAVTGRLDAVTAAVGTGASEAVIMGKISLPARGNGACS